MYKRFVPSEFIRSVFDITPEFLRERQIRGIITDLDNTLVEWTRRDATPDIIAWLQSLKEADIRVTIVSNNGEARVRAFADPLSIPFIHAARKPLSGAFQLAMRRMGLSAHEAAVVGDQMLTDIFGGNRLGLRTILVQPVAQSDGVWTRANRMVERLIYARLKKKGISTWEDKR